MMKSESAWLGIERICLRGERMSEHITAECHQVVPQFILDISRTEYAIGASVSKPWNSFLFT